MAFLSGVGLSLALIVAIGAQNVFVLRQGLRREHVLLVVVICAVSDAVLIAAGVAGIASASSIAPWLVTSARWAGAAFLVAYGLLAARRAVLGTDRGLGAEGAKPRVPAGRNGIARGSAGATALTCLALTWLNPHVYLDTVFLLGSLAASFGEARWLFAGGAATASVLWFASLGYGARYLGRWLSGPAAWRVLDGVIAVVMMGVAVTLVTGS